MSIVTKASTYLDNKHIHYQLLEHAYSHNSLSSAINSNVPTAQLVKAVMLEDQQGNQLMAILPSTHKINLLTLNNNLHRQFHLMKETDIYQLFADCEHGAIPPIAQAYDMEKVYDGYLLQQPILYLEGGDHRSLIKLTREEFKQMMQGANPLHFTHRVFH